MSLSTTLSTTLHLIDQFSAALSAPPSETVPEATQSPLPLLKASAASLKQNVTRLSLITLTPPFSASAISPLLNTLNTSILPSLITATHLITPTTFTSSFSAEATTLGKQCLADLKALLQLVSNRSRSSGDDLSEAEKNTVTQATGQVWARCDSAVAFADAGLAGFMTTCVGQWLELMKDAVKELEEWDPEDEVGDDPFNLDDIDEEDSDDEKSEKPDSGDRAILQAGVKTEALKVLTRIPQSMHVVVKQRLESKHLPEASLLSPAQRSTLDAIINRARKISESIDESAEAMYMGDLERCLKLAGKARSLTIDVVDSVKDPWKSGTESKEDIYIARALDWIRQVQPKLAQSNELNGIIAGTRAMKIS